MLGLTSASTACRSASRFSPRERSRVARRNLRSLEAVPGGEVPDSCGLSGDSRPRTARNPSTQLGVGLRGPEEPMLIRSAAAAIPVLMAQVAVAQPAPPLPPPRPIETPSPAAPPAPRPQAPPAPNTVVPPALTAAEDCLAG